MMTKRVLLPLLAVLLLASPVLAGRPGHTWLTRPEGVEGEQEGRAKLKLDREGEFAFFGVRARHLDADTYDLLIGDAVVGTMIVEKDDGRGGFRAVARRGDTLGVDDPAGQIVSVRASDGTVVLTGELPDPAEAPPPAPHGNAHDDLQPPPGGPADGKATGMIRVKSNRGGEMLMVGIHRVEAGTYDVLMDDGTGALVDIGDLVVEEGRPGGAYMVNTRHGDPLPLGAGSVTELVGRTVEVHARVAEGEDPVVVLKGTVPEGRVPPRHGRP